MLPVVDPNLVGLLGLIGGLLGVIVGAVAIVYAHQANNLARTSNTVAKDSKTLAVEANQLARDSNRLATEANTIAGDARQLAEEANTYSQRSESRETERHDVHWEGDWVRPGTYVLIKRGDDEAHQVKATVWADGDEVTQTAELVSQDGATLEFEFPQALAAFRAEVRERERRPENPPPFGVPEHLGPDWHSVVERVAWTTRHKAPKTHTSDDPFTSFEEFYPP